MPGFWDDRIGKVKYTADDPVFIASNVDLGKYFLQDNQLSIIDKYKHEDIAGNWIQYDGQPPFFHQSWGKSQRFNSETNKWEDVPDTEYEYIPPTNFVTFIPVYSELKTRFKRPVVDEFGNTFWVDGNDFTGTCAQFRWDTIKNLGFAREVKQYQDAYNKNNRGITCSCECRIGEK